MKKQGSRSPLSSKSQGFTLLELIVVLAGLGILSSLAIPNFIALLESNKVDEIKALLNSAAADCLQKARSQSDPIIDDEIISDGIIEKIGFKIDQKNSILSSNGDPKCSMIWLEPTNGDKNESVRYNIGFSLSDGNLDKLGSTVIAEKKSDCINWAGKCKFSKGAKILEEYKEKIREAKKTCDLQFTDWRDKNRMSPSKFKQWDPSKGPDTCPKIPPDDENDTSYQGTSSCTTAGCDPGVPVWGLWDKEKDTGTIYYDATQFEKARQKLVGVKCDKQIKEYEAKNYTNPSSNGVPLAECENELYWFVDGEITGPINGSEIRWKDRMCEKKIKEKEINKHTDLDVPSELPYCGSRQFYFCGGIDKGGRTPYRECVISSQSATCGVEIDDVRINGKNGKHTNTTLGPKPCGTTFWTCNQEIKYTEEEYKETSCGSCTYDDFMCQATGDSQYCCN